MELKRKKETTLFYRYFSVAWCIYNASCIYIYTFRVSFAVEKKKHHTDYPLIFGVSGSVIAIIFMALWLYAQKKCRGDKNTRERGSRVHTVYKSILSHLLNAHSINN